MKMQIRTLLLTTLFCSAAAAVGCSNSPGPSTGTGTGGTSGGGGGGTGTGTGVPLTPDANGFVAADTNKFMAQGAWYAYGDGAGPTGAAPGDCQNAGHTGAGECSKIDMPLPMMFPNTAGKMCTSGTVAKVIDIVGMPGMPDYGKIWGAGIGLDLNNAGGIAVKASLDAVAKGIKGIKFDLDMKPLAGLRVEAETTPTNGTEAGNDYWGATSSYPPSPVAVGTNTVLWSAFVGPKGHVFDPTKLLGIQFHVPASTASGGPYAFCISNFQLLE